MPCPSRQVSYVLGMPFVKPRDTVTHLPVEIVSRSIRQAVWQVDVNVPVTAIRGMSELVAASTAQQRFLTVLLASFAGIAVLLAALGMYATLAYTVNQRSREIGIRIALGSSIRQAMVCIGATGMSASTQTPRFSSRRRNRSRARASRDSTVPRRHPSRRAIASVLIPSK